MGILEGTYSGIREGPDDELWAFIDAYRLKPGFEEGADMVSLDISLACGYNENVECAVSGTENGTIHGNDGELMGITHGASYRSKLGGSPLGKALV